MKTTIEITPQGLYFPDTKGIGTPTPEETVLFTEQDIIVDVEGRPIHPDYIRLLGQHGARFGKGEFWRWGPNYTVDPVVIATEYGKNGCSVDDRVLTIVRKSNGMRALPAGFVDYADGQYEDRFRAAIREAREEAGIDISKDRREVLFNGHVEDDRETVNAWPHTTAILFRHSHFSPVEAGDDAVPGSAAWLRLEDLDGEKLHGSHEMLIRLGFNAVRAKRMPWA
ncbi:MAG TPA: NUDIX domain-containing protein [Candidatus Saccharimonas sp.]|nr:NUDIX domain-containing protein [Candidatus Saccharimonas sp.]